MKDLLISAEFRAYKQLIWQPPVDIYKDARGWLVKMELAGVRSEDIDVTVMGENLIIRGIRRDSTIQRGQKIYSMEISYNRFQRVVDIPCNMENVKIITDYRDGMLLIRLEMEKKK